MQPPLRALTWTRRSLSTGQPVHVSWRWSSKPASSAGLHDLTDNPSSTRCSTASTQSRSRAIGTPRIRRLATEDSSPAFGCEELLAELHRAWRRCPRARGVLDTRGRPRCPERQHRGRDRGHRRVRRRWATAQRLLLRTSDQQPPRCSDGPSFPCVEPSCRADVRGCAQDWVGASSAIRLLLAPPSCAIAAS
jgi:hypothetical protein